MVDILGQVKEHIATIMSWVQWKIVFFLGNQVQWKFVILKSINLSAQITS